jgi:hypothetical protein
MKPNKRENSMVTLDEIYGEVLNIKTDVQSVKHQTSWILRGHAEGVASHWREIFGIKPSTKRNYTKMRVYLETNGVRTVSEIALVTKVDVANVSRWLTEMEQERIVELLPVTKKKKIYQKTPADFALGISEQLREEITKKKGKAESND